MAKITKQSVDQLVVFVDWAKKIIQEDCVVEKVPHGDQSNVLKLSSDTTNYFLKIAPSLEKEKEKLIWLDGKAPVPHVVGFSHIEDQDVLLLSEIAGKNLAQLKKEWTPEEVVRALAETIKAFHSIDTNGCPFGEPGEGTVLVHGDACLPNFIFKDRTFIGYIDVGDVSIGSREIDLAAGVWSLQFNLGEGYGLRFLELYGVDKPDDVMVDMLRKRYEKMVAEWGFSTSN